MPFLGIENNDCLLELQGVRADTFYVTKFYPKHHQCGNFNIKTKGCDYTLKFSGQDEAVELNLGAKCAVEVEAGDTFVLRTPGGGGWGKSPQNNR